VRHKSNPMKHGLFNFMGFQVAFMQDEGTFILDSP
jgi:hypothetical protein